MPVCGVSAARQPFLGILSEDVNRTGHIGRFLVVNVSRGCTSGHFFVLWRTVLFRMLAHVTL